MRKVIVTTSWDDGHILDVRLADLLKKYGLKGTLYVSPFDRELRDGLRLHSADIKHLSKDFEIGAHTMTHPRLSQVSPDAAKKEIVDSKVYLEKVIGKKVKSFCYPGGDYQPVHKEIVKDAGFSFARTTKTFHTDMGEDRFEVPTSVHVYDHWTDIWPVLNYCGFNPFLFLKYFRHWDNLATAIFDRVLEQGGIFHLWGHSWEIDYDRDWSRLEKVFAYISNKNGVVYLSNGELYD